MACIAEATKYKKHVLEVLMPAIAQIMRNSLSDDVEADLRGHRDFAEWNGEGEDDEKCGDDPHVLLQMLHSITRRNRYENNIVFQHLDRLKLHEEQRNIKQALNESNSAFKQRCEDVERECRKCGLTPLTPLDQTLVFVKGLISGSKAHMWTLRCSQRESRDVT